MAIAGAAAGAARSLEAIMAEQMLQAKLAQQQAMEQARLQLDQRQLEGIETDREQNRAAQRATVELNQRKFNAEQADAATDRNIGLDAANVLNMPGMSDEAKANEFRQSALRNPSASSAPGMLKMVEGLTKKPERVQYTYTDPKTGQKSLRFTNKDDVPESGIDLGNEPPKPEKPVRENLTPGQAFSATRQLRNDFVRETSASKTVAAQTAIMQASIEAARKGDLAAGSQGVLVTFQKILDPGSVVRESEYARSASGQSLLARMTGAVQTLEKGGAGVPLAELERFVALANEFAKKQALAANATRKQIDAIATEYGLQPDNITRDYDGDFGDDQNSVRPPVAPGPKRLRFDKNGKPIQEPKP